MVSYCLLLRVMLEVCSEEYGTGPVKLQFMKLICLFLGRFESCVWDQHYGDWRHEEEIFSKNSSSFKLPLPLYTVCWAEPLILLLSHLPKKRKDFHLPLLYVGSGNTKDCTRAS